MLNIKRIIFAATFSMSVVLCAAQSNISAAVGGLGADFGKRHT